MGREKKAVRVPAWPHDEKRGRKPYKKPAIRILGTVRELTQVTGSGTNK